MMNKIFGTGCVETVYWHLKTISSATLLVGMFIRLKNTVFGRSQNLPSFGKWGFVGVGYVKDLINPYQVI